MAPREDSDDTKLCPRERKQYVIFDCSNHFITAFCSRREDHFGISKPVATDALANSRATKRTKSLILDRVSGDPSGLEDFSDAESLACFRTDVSNDEGCLNNLFHDDGTRKKLKLLAGIVGANSIEPGLVLAKVVTVLKGLEMRNGY
ncbi:Uncharacterized protein TCM_037827 [Theobroma cacao]|uniref:Uncharacterized protein n=1 Tax=Theobroma cacao TaxID=3641 RepID=A0A061GNK3_THECC|nr:Uncharacterized protein TCM_037827 [Theobroma cacao]